MNKIVLLGFVLSFALAACSREEPSSEAPEPEAVTEDVAPEAPAEAATGDADEGAQPELVEESAAEPDEAQAEKQPILLARETAPATVTAPLREWRYSEGQHYHRLVPTQPTVGGANKIEIAEIFWYGCPHCDDFDPQINAWSENIPPNARFVRIPAVWNPLARLHGRLYYTEEVLAKNGKLIDVEVFHTAVFTEFHRKSEDDFLTTWNSFEVNQKIRVANDLVKRYNVTGVPAVVVNGKYRTGAAEAGSYPNLLKVVDELIERETIR